MKIHLLFILSAVLIANVGMVTVAFGDETELPIYVNTNKSTYLETEIIEITGGVKELYYGMPVTVIVTSPIGNLVAVDQITVGDDKKFSLKVTVGGMMKVNGEYTISAKYATESAETLFNVAGFSSDVIEDIIQLEGALNPITYKITGGKIIDITPNVDGLSLIVTIDAFDDGSVTLDIPKTVFDSVKDDKDTSVLILIDGLQTTFKETITTVDRTITIPFTEGDNRIEIIGSFVIPEFGTIAAMILVVAIISIIAVSSKSRLNIMPRY